MASNATPQAAAAQSPASLLGSAAVNEKSDVSDVKTAAKPADAQPAAAAAEAAPAAKKPTVAQVSYQRNRITGNATTDEVCIRLLEEIGQLEGLAAEDPQHIAVVECLPVMKTVQNEIAAFVGIIRGITKITPETQKLVKFLFTASDDLVNGKSPFAKMPLRKARAAETQIQLAIRLHRFLRSRINKRDIPSKDGKEDLNAVDPSRFGFTIRGIDNKPLPRVSKEELTAYRSVLRAALTLYQAVSKNDKPMKQAQSNFNRAVAEQADADADDGSVYEDGDGSDYPADAPPYTHTNADTTTSAAAVSTSTDPAIALLATGALPVSA